MNRHLKNHLENDGRTGPNTQMSAHESDKGNLNNGKDTAGSQAKLAECTDREYQKLEMKNKDEGLQECIINEVEVIEEQNGIVEGQVVNHNQLINDEQVVNLVHNKEPFKDINHRNASNEVVDLCRDSEEELWERFDRVINNIKKRLRPRESKHKSSSKSPVKVHENKKDLKNNFKYNKSEKSLAKRSNLSLHQEIHKKGKNNFNVSLVRKATPQRRI